jgi:hypothetical protein
MSSEKVARLLADFDQPEAQRARGRIVPFDHALHFNPKSHSAAKPQPKPAVPPAPALPPEDDAFERGRTEGYAAALAEYEQRLHAEKEAWNVQLDEERYGIRIETAARIAGDIEAVGNQLEAKIAAVVARILEPLISSAVQKQAVASFVEQLSTLASDIRRPVLRITGPSELLDIVRSKLGVRAISVELRVAPVTEVSMTLDQLVMESQVKLWTDRLRFAVQA